MRDGKFLEKKLRALWTGLFICTKIAKIVTTRHVFWAENIRKILLRPGLCLDAAGGALLSHSAESISANFFYLVSRV